MPKDWGQCYMNHFKSYFGDPVAKRDFGQNTTSPPIRILTFDDVFEGCQVFCSLGFAQYAEVVGTVSEALIAVDDGWDDVPTLLANALFGIVQHSMHFGAGVVIQGLENIQPQFADVYQKTGLFFTTTYTISTLPESIGQVACNGNQGGLHAGYFISPEEILYWETHKSARFEKLLGEEKIDLLHLRRQSVV